MKLKKYFFIFGGQIILVSLSLIIFLNININKNIDKNETVLDTFNNIFPEQNVDFSLEDINNLPKLQMEGTDYIGIINITKSNLSIPIESTCNNSFISIQSVCNYSNESLIILGTNLKDSFSLYKSYDVEDTIKLTNMLGQTFQYKITKIKRINELNDLSNYNEELMIVVKNYYSMEYILFTCVSY